MDLNCCFEDAHVYQRPQADLLSSSSRPCHVMDYLDELWSDRTRDEETLRATEETQQQSQPPQQLSEQDEFLDMSEEWQPSAMCEPGSFGCLLSTLHRLSSPTIHATADHQPQTSAANLNRISQRHVHLLPRHPNLIPIEEYTIRMDKELGSITHCLQFPPIRLSLYTLLRYYQRPGLFNSKNSLGTLFSNEQIKFLIYQLLSFVSWLHGHGLAHGALNPKNLLLTVRNGKIWLYVTGMKYSLRRSAPSSPSIPDSLLLRWWNGELSNFDYILALNSFVGREPQGGFTGDVSFHPICPWIIDFAATSVKVDKLIGSNRTCALTSTELQACLVYRDLSVSKYRLKKGDEQLDFQYSNSFPHQPYHITEPLSDITYFMYRSRITSLKILRKVVRTNFVAEEYPANMSKLDQWTPDECIPEFFTDSSIFKVQVEQASLGMKDLEVPHWIPGIATSTDKHATFVDWHRQQFESESVSRHLHEWIDLNFGYKLTGSAAIHAKNVPMNLHETHGHGHSSASSDNHSHGSVFALPQRPPFMQLFHRPHPPKRVLNTTHAEISHISTHSSSITNSQSTVDPLIKLNQQLAELSQPPPIFSPIPNRARISPLTTDILFSPSPALTLPNDPPLPAQSSTSRSQSQTNPPPTTVVSLSKPLPSLDSASGPGPNTSTAFSSSLDDLYSFQYFHSFNLSFENEIEDGFYGPSNTHQPNDQHHNQKHSSKSSRTTIKASNVNKRSGSSGKRTRHQGPDNEDGVNNFDEFSSSSSDSDDEGLPAGRAALSSSTTSPITSLDDDQLNDLFAVGLILAEFYLLHPLFSTRTAAQFLSSARSERESFLNQALANVPIEISHIIKQCCLPGNGKERSTIHHIFPVDPISKSNRSVSFLTPTSTTISIKHTSSNLLSDSTASISWLDAFSSHHLNAPHTNGPIKSNFIQQPYEQLFQFMARWRQRIRRVVKQDLDEIGTYDHNSAYEWSHDSSESQSSTTSTLIQTPFLHTATDSSTIFSPEPTGLLRSDSELNEEADAAAITSNQTNEWKLEDVWDEAISPIRNTSTSSNPSAGMWTAFWSCQENGQSVSNETIASLIEWLVHTGLTQLYESVPTELFQLFIPHAFDLILKPSFLHATDNHASIRQLFDLLTRLLDSTSCESILQPFFSFILLHSHSPTSFQLSFIFSVETLRFLHTRMGWSALLKDVLHLIRNSIISPVEMVATKAATVLTEFILIDLFGSNLSFTGPSLGLSIGGCEEDLFIGHILLPMFQRLSAPMMGNKIVPSNSTVLGSSTFNVVGSLHSSSVDKILHFLLQLRPELPLNTISHVLLPNVLALIEAGLSGSTPLPTTRASINLGNLSLELDAKLTNGLDLLYDLLPDLTNDMLNNILNESSLIKRVLLSIGSTSAGPGSQRVISSVCMNKLIQVIVYICNEFSSEAIDAPQPSPPLIKEKDKSDKDKPISSPPVILSRFAPFLPHVSEFLRLVVARLEASTNSDYTETELHGFLHAIYVSLSSILGRLQLQQAIPLSTRYESIIQDHAKFKFLTATTTTQEQNEFIRARQHVLKGKANRMDWSLREQKRVLIRRTMLEAYQNERNQLAAQFGISIGDDDGPNGPTDGLISPDPVNTDLEDPFSSASPPTVNSSSTTTNKNKSSVRKPLGDEGLDGENQMNSTQLDESMAMDDEDEGDATKSSTTLSAAKTPQPSEKVPVEKKKRTGFFNTGIFAPKTPLIPPTNSTPAPPTNTASAMNEKTVASTSTSVWTPIEFGDLLLPTTQTTASTTHPSIHRFNPHLCGSLRAHSSPITVLDVDSNGLIITGSRSGDSFATVKLWTISRNEGGVRPIQNYSSKSSTMVFPKQNILGVRLLTNPREYLNSAYGFCDGARFHLIDIETNQPIIFRQSTNAQPYYANGTSSLLSSPTNLLKAMPLVRGSTASTVDYSPSQLNLSQTSPHFSRSDPLRIGGVTCFDYMPSMHSIVVGTTTLHNSSTPSVRLLDLRTGGGYYQTEWKHTANPAVSVAPTVKSVVAQHDHDYDHAGHMASDHFLYSGLSSGEIAIFDRRIGIILHQWRGHDAAILQLLPFYYHGHQMLASSGADHVVCIWIIPSSSSPILHQRVSSGEENIRGMIIRSSLTPESHPDPSPSSLISAHTHDLRELICTIGGGRLGSVVIVSPRANKKLHARFNFLTVQEGSGGGANATGTGGSETKQSSSSSRGGKNRMWTAITQAPTHGLTLMGQEDGKLVLIK